jgi:alkylation response protein AidB-like acyl-CoA dehydrogenase
MEFSLSDEQKMLRESIVKFAQRELNHGVIERDRAQAFSPAVWKKCAEIGIQGLPVPEEEAAVAQTPCHVPLRSRRSDTVAATADWYFRCAATCSLAWCRCGNTEARRNGAVI